MSLEPVSAIDLCVFAVCLLYFFLFSVDLLFPGLFTDFCILWERGYNLLCDQYLTLEGQAFRLLETLGTRFIIRH